MNEYISCILVFSNKCTKRYCYQLKEDILEFLYLWFKGLAGGAVLHKIDQRSMTFHKNNAYGTSDFVHLRLYFHVHVSNEKIKFVINVDNDMFYIMF